MFDGPQSQILDMLRTRKRVTSAEFIREVAGWDHRKVISRLRRKGYPIESVIKPGDKYATYLWVEEQMRLI